MTNKDNLKDRTLTLERIFDAPLALVWEAWTQADHIVKWWGPQGMDIQVVEHTFEVGGKWKYIMPMPDGSEFVSEGEYLEIIEGEKIVTTANFRPMTEGVELDISFREMDGKTHFIFRCIHPSEEYCQQQEKMGFYNGWGSAFDRLSHHLGSMVGSSHRD